MNLQQARSKSLDDIFFMGLDYIKRKPNLPLELCNTNEYFLSKVYEVYTMIEKDKIISFEQDRKTGMTTALNFIIAYYALNNSKITVLTNPGVTSLKVVVEKFYEFIGLDVKGNFMSNSVILKYEDEIFCEITLAQDSVFDISSLNGIVVFDTINNLENYSKYSDLMKTVKNDKNNKKFKKVVLNFPDCENIRKIVDEYKIERLNIKIQNNG